MKRLRAHLFRIGDKMQEDFINNHETLKKIVDSLTNRTIKSGFLIVVK